MPRIFFELVLKNAMRLADRGLRRIRAPIALLLSLAIICSPAFPRSAFPTFSFGGEQQVLEGRSSGDTKISSAAAIALNQGVLVNWKTAYEFDNVGFNVYQIDSTKRFKLNREIIAGSVFIVGQGVPLRAGYSYSFFDRSGTSDSTYSVEAVGLDGSITSSSRIVPQWQRQMPFEVDLIDSPVHQPLSEQTGYPSESSAPVPEGQIEDQWAITSQFGLKISINKAGWYRVTHQKMSAAGFNPAVDIENLQLFNNARELAIFANRTRGPFVVGDYIEFYGQGVDTASTDFNVYYLLAGSTPGKRIVTVGKRTHDQVRPEALPANIRNNVTTLPALELNSRSWFWWIPNPSEYSDANRKEKSIVETVTQEEGMSLAEATDSLPPSRVKSILSIPLARPALPERFTRAARGEGMGNTPMAAQLEAPIRALAHRTAKRKGRKNRKKPRLTRQYAHPRTSLSAAIQPSFDYSVQKKDRSVYFVSLLNGDTENFFGQVITSLPVVQTLTTLNPEKTASATALLEIALQGASHTNHAVNIQFNRIAVGTMNLIGLERKVQTFPLPISGLTNGDNSITLTPGTGSGITLVDYTRLRYAHSYRADNDSLRFSVEPMHRVRVDGFSSSGIRVIDYTDPFGVRILNPLIELNDSGFTIQLAAATGQSSSPRLLYAFTESEVDQSASLSLNQPSSLNLSTNGADLLIISHKSFIPSLTPLVSLRSSQGLTVLVVDVDDIYDEFGYGAHGPQAIRNFLAFVSDQWSRVPQYVILGGDASYDPRNYLGFGNRDFVPSKLVDATFNETSSDDWLTDFNNDGIADIPVGRLPVSTQSQANIVVSKIVSFAPTNVPQSALLVADAQRNYYFNFEQANSQVQALLPASMVVERVDRRTEPSDAQASINIVNKLNSGQQLVNYSGHGNVNTWTDGSIFTTDLAMSLTNGNKLPFVVVTDCLNGYFHEPSPGFSGLAEAFLQAPNGGAVASFASSGLTIPDGQHEMSLQLYTLLYGSQPIALGDAIKIAKASTNDMDVRRTWIFFGDPSMKIR
jgi:hypothetical protein